MMDLADKIQLYLPQYLSAESQKIMKEELARFPMDGTKDSVYTCALDKADYLLQGDGIKGMPYIKFPDMKIADVPALLLSNTCDMATDNKRMYGSRVIYAPILNLEKFEAKLKKEFGRDRAASLIHDIRKQHISQILYLPKGGKLDYEGIVFFDHAISIPLEKEIVYKSCENRLFTFSNFGFYLFLLKLSIHFTRIQERVDRSTGEDLGQK